MEKRGEIFMRRIMIPRGGFRNWFYLDFMNPIYLKNRATRNIVPNMNETTQIEDLLDLDSLDQAAECLRTLAHPHRLRIVQMLLRGTYTVGELAESCGIASNVASEHLRLMKHCGFIRGRKEGRRTYYEVVEPHLKDIMACVESRFG